jgi:DNA-binding response OmpR family regulator
VSFLGSQGVGRLLVVEDDPGQLLALTDRLSSEGYEVDQAADGEEGVQKALDDGYDLILLDVMLPAKSGFDVCSELRGKGVQAPILMLTARDQISDKVVGLELGADDYVTKPYEFIELLARVKALLRRSGSRLTEHFAFGDVEVNFSSAEVHRRGKPVKLAAREFQLLRYFIENRGAVLSRNDLLDAVWGEDAMPTGRTVDVHVARLRQKLERDAANPRHIVTVRGLGYRFDDVV